MYIIDLTYGILTPKRRLDFMKKLLCLTLVLLLPVLLTLSCMKGDSVLPTENIPPDTPTNPFPADSADGINPESVTLSWECTDPNWDDLTYTLTWYIYYYWETYDTVANLTTPEYTLNDLAPGAHYVWRITAKDEEGDLSISPLWHFYTEDMIVNIPDIMLEMSIRYAIDKPTGDLYASDIGSLHYLYTSSFGITCLTGLEYAIGLRDLSLGNNLISDLSPLSNLINLRYLNLHNNLFSDLSPLADLTSLLQLDLGDNQITTIPSLPGLTQLRYFYLSNNQISDISALSELQQLYSLDLCNNQIADISPLAEIEEMTYLYISGNQISDLSPLSSMINLNALRADSNLISDISALTDIPFLGNLYLNRNQISDLSALSDKYFLRTLYLDNNQISDISHLDKLYMVYTLSLSDNQITNIAPLVDNPGLGSYDELYLYNNPLDSMSINVYIPELEARGVNVNY